MASENPQIPEQPQPPVETTSLSGNGEPIVLGRRTSSFEKKPKKKRPTIFQLSKKLPEELVSVNEYLLAYVKDLKLAKRVFQGTANEMRFLRQQLLSDAESTQSAPGADPDAA